MGTFTLSKTNRLFWLGRYVERAYIAIELMEQAYDEMIDGPTFDYVEYCNRLNIPTESYENAEDFVGSYLFDQKNPDSAATALSHAFDNAVVLRETLGSSTLSYIQLAVNAMENAKISMAPMLDLQIIRDYLMAFKGCVDDLVDDNDSRMIVKVGFTVERIDMCLRLGYQTNTVAAHLDRLDKRLQRTHMQRDGKYLRLLIDLVPCPNPEQNKDILLECIENLFPDA